jgi:hypothetical protein
MAFGESYAWGIGSFAAGTGSAATGDYSIAIGKNVGIIPNYAYGYNSIALGTSIVAGNYGVGIGWTKIDANEAYGMGHNIEVDAFGSVVVGRCNLISGNTTNWIPTDPIFVIGNGESTSARSNAMTVLKNGSVGIGTALPSERLDVRGCIRNTTNATYDVWIQGGAASSGDARNLALLGDIGTDKLFLNYGGEYAGGTIIYSNVGIGTQTPGYRLQVGDAGDGSQARANAWNLLSDASLKTNFTKPENSLEMIERINGYYFYWNTGSDKTKQFGFSAQEIDKVLPEIVSKGVDGLLSLDYGKVTPLLVEAIKEQQHQIESQQKEIDDLKALVNSLIENQTALVNE